MTISHTPTASADPTEVEPCQKPPAITIGHEKFTLFPKLPPEIQNKIWMAAANVPRIIPYTVAILNEREHTLPVRDNAPLLAVSFQARQEVAKVQKPCCWDCAVRDDHTIPVKVLHPEVFVNKSVDTLWFLGKEFCPDDEIPEPPDGCKKLAMSKQCWENTLENTCFSWWMSEAIRYGITELIIVVGSDKAKNEREIIFTTPRFPPKEYFSSFLRIAVEEPRGDDWKEDQYERVQVRKSWSWKKLGKRARKSVKNLRTNSMAEWKELLDSGLTREEINAMEMDVMEYFKTRHWKGKIPKIKFREATTPTELLGRVNEEMQPVEARASMKNFYDDNNDDYEVSDSSPYVSEDEDAEN